MNTLRAFVFAAAVALAACGGGSGSPSAASIPQTPKNGMATFSIAVPAQSSTANKPHYVSPNTQSASISVNGGTPATIALTAGSSNCTSSSTGLQCSISITAPIGSDTFAISLYASTNATGTPLATQSISASITADQTTPVSVTLNGVVASLALALSNASPQEGAASDVTLTVTAKDAAGATIIGPGNFASPITVADDDTSGATSLSGTQITVPGASAVTVHYTGAHVVAHFSASAGSVTPAIVTLQSVPVATPSPTPTPTSTPTAAPATEYLWVANYGGRSVLAFDTSSILSGGSPAPVTVLSGSNTGFSTYSPQCVQQDSVGDLFVVGSQGSTQPGAIMYFGGGTTGGNLTPTATISGNNTTLVNPVGCAFDASGDLWVANDDNYNDSLVMFTNAQLTSGGNVAPMAIVQPVTCCQNTSLCNTVGVAFDPGADLWTGSLCAATVEFQPQQIASTGAPSPVAYIQPGGVNDLTFDSSGNLWRALGGSIDEYNASNLPSAPDVTPDVTISGAATQIGTAFGISFDSSGNLWVADNANNALLMFAKSNLAAGGNIAPSAVISGNLTQLSGPADMQFFALPRIPTIRRR